MKKAILSTLIVFFAASFLMSGISYAEIGVDAQSINPSWKFSITGLVSNPSNFTLAELQSMPQTNVLASLYCVSSPTIVLEQGSWQGVKLWTLLTQAGISTSAFKIALHAIDGFSCDLTIEDAKSDNIIVAYTLNGQALSEVVRLVVPYHWGYKWINQIINIEAVDFDYKGTYESQGYSDDGAITQPIPTFPSFSNSPSTSNPSPTNTITTTPSVSPNPSTSSNTISPTSAPSNVNSTVFWEIGIVAAILLAFAVSALILRRRIGKNNKIKAL